MPSILVASVGKKRLQVLSRPKPSVQKTCFDSLLVHTTSQQDEFYQLSVTCGLMQSVGFKRIKRNHLLLSFMCVTSFKATTTHLMGVSVCAGDEWFRHGAPPWPPRHAGGVLWLLHLQQRGSRRLPRPQPRSSQVGGGGKSTEHVTPVNKCHPVQNSE